MAELQAEAEAMQFRTAQTTPHEYTLVEASRNWARRWSPRSADTPEFCFDTDISRVSTSSTTASSGCRSPWNTVQKRGTCLSWRSDTPPEYAEIAAAKALGDEKIAKIEQNISLT